MISLDFKDWEECSRKFSQLCAEAPAALALLHKVTGKMSWREIDPLREKRWGPKCDEAYTKMVDLFDFMDGGILRAEIIKDLNESKPLLSGFKSIGPFDGLPDLAGKFDKFSKQFPDLKKEWVGPKPNKKK